MSKKQVLWFSRHQMTEEQQAAFEGMEITQIDRTINSAYDIKDDIDKADIIAVVAPINIQQQFLKIAADKPVLTALSNHQPDGTFQFEKWEQIKNIKVQTHELTPEEIEGKKNMLWFSRHDMTDEQKEMFKDFEIKKLDKSIENAYEIKDEIDKADVVGIVAPIHLHQQILKIAGEKPVIQAVSDRVLVPQPDGTETKVVFQFNHWDRLDEIAIEKEDYIAEDKAKSMEQKAEEKPKGIRFKIAEELGIQMDEVKYLIARYAQAHDNIVVADEIIDDVQTLSNAYIQGIFKMHQREVSEPNETLEHLLFETGKDRSYNAMMSVLKHFDPEPDLTDMENEDLKEDLNDFISSLYRDYITPSFSAKSVHETQSIVVTVARQRIQEDIERIESRKDFSDFIKSVRGTNELADLIDRIELLSPYDNHLTSSFMEKAALYTNPHDFNKMFTRTLSNDWKEYLSKDVTNAIKNEITESVKQGKHLDYFNHMRPSDYITNMRTFDYKVNYPDFYKSG